MGEFKISPFIPNPGMENKSDLEKISDRIKKLEAHAVVKTQDEVPKIKEFWFDVEENE